MASISTKKDSEEQRNIPQILKKLLVYDVRLTKDTVAYMLNFVPFRSLQVHCRFLEISCHGIAWLAGWLAFIWLIDRKELYEMQINMIFGLILDIIIVAVIKAATRRRRPRVNDDIFSIGPDKFSFPSGHASRAFFIFFFFTWLYPMPIFFWPPLFAWAFSVALSRLLAYRHHIFDVFCGVVLGFIESALLAILWLGPSVTNWIMVLISEDSVPGGPESA